MPRRKVPAQSEFPYHVTARTVNREFFWLPLDQVWDIMGDYLYLVVQLYGLEIHAFVLMSNHFHWLVSAPLGNLSQALNYFLRETSREITRLSGRENQTYGGRNLKTLINSPHYYMNTYKYIYQNPVRAGICRFVEAYPYSTLHGRLGLRHLIIPMAEDLLLFNPHSSDDILQWLNTPVAETHVDEMRKALKKAQFKFARKEKLPSELEKLLI